MSYLAKTLDKLWNETALGQENSAQMFLIGRTLKKLAAEIGKAVAETTDGKKILDDELYECTSRGIYLVR